jgi:hypothetical protein
MIIQEDEGAKRSAGIPVIIEDYRSRRLGENMR